MHNLYNSTTYNELLCQHTYKGQTLKWRRLSLFVIISRHTTFIHPFNDAFSYFFIKWTFVSLFKNGESIKIRFCYTKKALPVQKGGATSNDCRSVCCEIYRMSNYCWTCSLFNKSRTTIKKKPQHMLWSACWGFHIQWCVCLFVIFSISCMKKFVKLNRYSNELIM